MTLEINSKRKPEKFTNMWRLNNMPINNQGVKEEIKRESKKYLETNENGDTRHQNLWMQLLRGKFITNCTP